MALQGTKRITVHAVNISEGSLFSKGVGFDELNLPVDFIGNTDEMRNIKIDLDDFEDGDIDVRPTIWLKAWQWSDEE